MWVMAVRPFTWEYQRLLRKARWLLRQHPICFLAETEVANHELMGWFTNPVGGTTFRLPCDVLLRGASKYPRLVGNAITIRRSSLGIPPRSAFMRWVYRYVLNGTLAQEPGIPRRVVTDEPPSCKPYSGSTLQFQVERIINGIASQAHLARVTSRCRPGTSLSLWSSALCHHAGMSVPNQQLALLYGCATLAAQH